MDNMEEIWKDIKGYEGLYQVSNFGRVKSLDRWAEQKNRKSRFIKGVMKKQHINKSGYLTVGLCKDSKGTHYLVHRLVADAFIPNVENLSEVNHKDEVKTNNCVDNLEWCNHYYNSNYGTRTERMIPLLNTARKKSNEVLSKTVYQYSLEGDLIKIYNSTHATTKYGFSQGCVARCCRGESETYKGYIWKYEN